MPFPTKRLLSAASFFPLDFYRFKHTEEAITKKGKYVKASKPLWIVGVSPFDDETHDDEGHVVHLGQPSFLASWSMNEDRIEKVSTPTYYDEDLNLILYDVIPLANDTAPSEEWLVEAVCAVGYSKGLIAMAPSEGVH